jgi:hypothetical protein
MNKNIGFRRNIYRSWLDAAAILAAETDDPAQLRTRLDPILAARIEGAESRRMALDILLNIWGTMRGTKRPQREEALALWQTSTPDEHLWLHYGLTLIQYPFFRLSVATIGHLSQYKDTMTPKDLKSRLSAELGQPGALEKAAERVLFSLRDWGILAPTAQRYHYQPQRQMLCTEQKELQLWLLAAALLAHPAEEIPFADLIRLPELFPFRFSLRVQDLRESERFEVTRQGMNWDMVSLASYQQVPTKQTPTPQARGARPFVLLRNT